MYTPPLSNLVSTNGTNKGAIKYFDFCPIDWLTVDVQIDPILRSVNTPIQLLPGRALLRASCLPESIGFNEKQNPSKSGSYHDQKLVGVINKDDLEKNLQLDTLRYYKLLVIYFDKNDKKKIIGNKIDGMDISSALEVETTTAGKTYYQLELTHQTEPKSAFYTV